MLYCHGWYELPSFAVGLFLFIDVTFTSILQVVEGVRTKFDDFVPLIFLALY